MCIVMDMSNTATTAIEAAEALLAEVIAEKEAHIAERAAQGRKPLVDRIIRFNCNIVALRSNLKVITEGRA